MPDVASPAQQPPSATVVAGQTQTVAPLVARWTRNNNRRRMVEEILATLSSVALVGAIGVVIHRAGWALSRLGGSRPAWFPSDATLAWTVYVLGGVGAAVVVARGILRYRRRRLSDLQMAKEVDAAHGNVDLLSTAIAIEAGHAAGSPEAQAIAHARAQQAASGLPGAPVRGFRPNGRLMAGSGLATAAAVAGLLLLSGDSAFGFPLGTTAALDADTEEDVGDATDEEEPPPLSDDTKERLDNALKHLEKFENNPALRREAKETLAEARDHLQKAMNDPKHTLGELSRAEQALRRLAKQARNEGLYDQEQMKQMSTEELAKQMSEAMKEQDNQTASELGEELARRMEEASMSELRSMARAFERNFESTDSPPRPGGESGPRPGESAEERAERWKKRLEEMTEQMRRGESGLSSSDMRGLADEMRKSGGGSSMERSLDEALSDIRKAREGRLGEMGEGKPGEGEGKPGEGKPGEGSGKPGEGKPSDGGGDSGKPGEGSGKPGEGEGKPGEGEGKPGEGSGKPGEGEGGEGGEGDPSGKPGPGGGDGSFAHGSMGFLPPGVGTTERTDTPKAGPDKGAIRIIQRISAGRRDAEGQYKDLHQHYEEVAEEAVRQDQIPLTRREYIREYFEAVRR